VSASVPHNEWTADSTTPSPVRLLRLGDERLAWFAARGSTRAFATVYERYHRQLYRYCRSIVHDDADAQDALQSTFTRALSALKRDRRNAPLRPWLFRIAHNESISVLRRRRGGVSDPSDAAPLLSAPSAADQAGERARLAMLMGDLAALPDRARNALVMRELSGLSHEDIGIALDISEGAAKQAIFEARRGLHECAEGRAMLCAEVCRAISDGDRRVLRGRRVRAHIRDCASCAAFASAIVRRQAELRALVPVLPAAASAAVLARIMHGSAVGGGIAGGGAGGGGAAVAGTAGKTVGIAIGGKGFAAASLLATAAVSVGGVATVVRLSHDGRPAVDAGGRHAAPARAAVHRVSTAGGLPAPASVRAAVGAASGTSAALVGKLPARATSARGHGRWTWSRGRSASSHGRPRSLAHGKSGSSSPGQSAAWAPGHSGSSSPGKSASSPGHSESSSLGKSTSTHGKSAASNGEREVKSASSAHGVGKLTAPGQVKKTPAVTEQHTTVNTNSSKGLGAAKKEGSDVGASPALTSGKAHK
jgi:RNA polymerase sigma factor (sigma-70 family)